jgi:hypothetical protein
VVAVESPYRRIAMSGTYATLGELARDALRGRRGVVVYGEEFGAR